MREETFDSLPHQATSGVMTLGGAMLKTAMLIVMTMCAAGYSYGLAFPREGVLPSPLVTPMFWGGMIGGLVLALVTVFKKEWSPITAPLYAIVKGLFVGVISAHFAASFEGIVVQAVLLTFGLALLMTALYVLRIIQPTQKFKMVILCATGGIALLYLLTFGLSFIGISVPYIHDSGPIGIGFSIFVVAIAALNLIIDFELVEVGAAHGAPKYMEWYAGFAILVTLIWLYIEILRLLAKLRGRR